MRWRGVKVLAVCEHGNSRSVALAFLLKRRHRADALAVGISKASAETFEMLCKWADRIIVVDQTLAGRISQTYAEKVSIWDVGPDIYFKGFKRQLLEQFDGYLTKSYKKEDPAHDHQD